MSVWLDDLESIRKSIKILNDHSGQMASDLRGLSECVAGLRTDIAWLKMLMVPTAIAAIASAIKALM